MDRRDRQPTEADEQTRLARLRQQDGAPLVPPESLRRLLRGGRLDPARLDEAFAVHRATIGEVETTGSPDAAERLYFLTLVANEHLRERGEHERRRALLETALAVLFLPRHTQVVRGLLATAAAKRGDLRAAEQWLAACDPRSADLESDSAYRAARAYVDTIQHDHRAVLEVLGKTDEEVPILDVLVPQCAVLRANALERTGDVAAAGEVLRARMAKLDANGRRAMQRIVDDHPELSLCPLSFPEAVRAHTELAAQAAAQALGGAVGSFLVGAGVVSAILGVVLSVVVPGEGLVRLAPLLGPSIAAVALIVQGLGLNKRAREAAFVRSHGLPARGSLVAIRRTGTKINGVPLMELEVGVERPGAAPYPAKFRQLMPTEVSAQLQPGVELPLRVHPDQPDRVLMELL